MRRRSSVLLTGVAAIALVAVAPANAQIRQVRDWNVAVVGTETTNWSFSGERPAKCEAYYGTSGYTAGGKGTIRRTVKTTPKKRLTARTYLFKGKLKFSSYSTGGWAIPATLVTTGTAMSVRGKPCNWNEDDPEPLPDFVDTGGCGTTTGTTSPGLGWAPQTLIVRLGSFRLPARSTACPRPSETIFHLSRIAACIPKDLGLVPAAAAGFTRARPKPFTVKARRSYRCTIPSTDPAWEGGSAAMTMELTTDYTVTFIPR